MEFKGCYVAIVTPFTRDNKVDEAGLRSNIEFLIERGVAGIVPCGTTGESATLSWEEHTRVVDIAISAANRRVQVIAGAGSNNTVESIEAARHAKKSGTDAILCITPYYNKPTQEGLFQHFKAISTAVDIPMMLYNVPGRTGTNMLPETVERLCELPTVASIKEASGDVSQISEVHRRCGGRLDVLSGDDGLTLPVLACGGKGIVSVIGNIVPDRLSALVKMFFSGNLAEALRMHEELLPLCKAAFFETNPSPIKAAMNYLGLAAGSLRLPMVEMSDGNKAKLLAVIDSMNLKTIKA